MRTLRTLPVIAVLVAFAAACGETQPEPTPPPPAATAGGLEGYSQGVKDYYAGVELGSTASVEEEYHQPPQPAEAALGETITLTGSNIGVRLKVTVTAVERVSDYQAVQLAFESTGITNYENPLSNATLTFSDGRSVMPVEDANAPCSQDLATPTLFVPVGGKARGCLLFPPAGAETPERFQLALETVPVEAGGIWNLR
ncbi:MAG TPA: hypothetical protein VFZ00_23515 [Solirubrobacter sp.]|nr:hypothetical protein [Solirubrobacter sp.]